MKKIVCCVLAIVMLLALTGCMALDTPTKEAGEQSVVSQEKETAYGINETAAFKSLKFTATEIKESDGANFFTPEDGNVFVGVKFTIENTSNEEQGVSSLLLFEGYADDVKIDYSVSAACAFDGTLDGAIAPGKKLVGWYAMEVPEDWATIELQVQGSLLSDAAKFVFKK